MTDRKPRVLATRHFPPDVETRLSANFDARLNPEDKLFDGPGLIKASEGFDGIMCAAGDPLNADTIAKLPASVKMIATFSVGYEHVDVAAAAKRNIKVSNTPDVLTDATADIAMLCLLGAARRAHEGTTMLRTHGWIGWEPTQLMGVQVTGKRLGILGMGRIGRVIARRASGFDMEVRYHNRRELDDVDFVYADSLEALAEWADFLVIASAGGAETRGLVSREILDALGPRGYLVNISRGTVVDEAALVEALQHKRIAGAGLDVFKDEPNVPEALFALDNVVLLPHLASNTHETRAAMAQRVEDNLAAFLAGKPMVSAAA